MVTKLEKDQLMINQQSHTYIQIFLSLINIFVKNIAVWDNKHNFKINYTRPAPHNKRDGRQHPCYMACLLY